MLKRAVAAFCVAVSLTGCIFVAQDQANKGKTALVGKSRSQILACAGIPNATFRDGGTEFFAYAASGMRREDGDISYVGNGVFLTSSATMQAQCIVTLSLRGGVVASVNYRSSGGAITAPDEACGYVVRSCL